MRFPSLPRAYMAWLLLLFIIFLRYNCFVQLFLKRQRSFRASLLPKDDIELLVGERLQCRLKKDYERADSIKTYLESKGIVITDYPNPTWQIAQNPLLTLDLSVLPLNHNETSILGLARRSYDLLQSGKSSHDRIAADVIQLINIARLDEMPQARNFLVNTRSEYKDLPTLREGVDFGGRKAADVAFELCLAGIRRDDMFHELANFVASELKRTGSRKSCLPIIALQMVEKLAAAGVRDQYIFQIAASILKTKGDKEAEDVAMLQDAIESLSSGCYSLFCDRPLLWLWRYASRQSKYGRQSQQVVQPEEEEKEEEEKVEGSRSTTCNTSSSGGDDVPLNVLFEDPTLPLIIDLGCGFGVSLLGLAAHEQQEPPTLPADHTRTDGQGGRSKSRYNFCGCDLSPRGISYANGIAHRWGMQSYCTFIVSDVISMLKRVQDEYPGPVQAIHINFPTPYKFGTNLTEGYLVPDAAPTPSISSVDAGQEYTGVQPHTNSSGNKQLPNRRSDFMIDAELVTACQQLLGALSTGSTALFSAADNNDRSYNNTSNDITSSSRRRRDPLAPPPYLLIQTNVEDVAVNIRAMIELVNHKKMFRVNVDDENAVPVLTVVDDIGDVDRICASWAACEIPRHLMNSELTRATSAEKKKREVMKPPRWMSLEDLAASSGEGEEVDTRAAGNSSGNSSDYKISDELLLHQQGDGGAIDESSSLRYSPQLRTAKWIASGGSRAAGPGWLRSSVLPSTARTETEVMCEIERKPVHRILFILQQK